MRNISKSLANSVVWNEKISIPQSQLSITNDQASDGQHSTQMSSMKDYTVVIKRPSKKATCRTAKLKQSILLSGEQTLNRDLNY